MPTTRKTRSSDTYIESWYDLAACRTPSASELPWIENDAESVAKCTAVCNTCPVRERCGETYISFVDHHGTVGGTSRAQRVWLRANPDTAELIAADCRRARVKPEKLYEWYVAEGPAALPSDAASLTERQIAVRYGVDVEVFQQWLMDRGLAEHNPVDGRTNKMHVDAYDLVEDYLQTALVDGDGWVSRTTITDLLEAVLPVSMIAHTHKAQTSHRAA